MINALEEEMKNKLFEGKNFDKKNLYQNLLFINVSFLLQDGEEEFDKERDAIMDFTYIPDSGKNHDDGENIYQSIIEEDKIYEPIIAKDQGRNQNGEERGHYRKNVPNGCLRYGAPRARVRPRSRRRRPGCRLRENTGPARSGSSALPPERSIMRARIHPSRDPHRAA